MTFDILAAYCSQNKNGVTGEIARVIGDVVILCECKRKRQPQSGTIAFSKQCLMAVRSIRDSIFSIVNGKDRRPMRQMNIRDVKTT
mmetsp:Transcript_6328/g.15687  ORF Transcript_6328/g.15687 Transcript_6328/m.15687 type:complete len:86 (+) Transcript_6328:543-800(+)